MKSKAAIIIDSVSISLICGIVAYSWCNFYTKNILTSVFCALLVILLSVGICFIFNKRYLKKQNITKQLTKAVNDIYDKLLFCSNHSQMLWLKQSIYKENNALLFNNFLYYNNTVIYNALLKKINENDISQIIRNILDTLKDKPLFNITILCDEHTKQATMFCTSLNIKVELLDKFRAVTKFNLNAQQLYTSISVKKQPKNLKYLFSYALSIKRTKSYLALGLILIICSFFVLYRVYYLILGSILLTMCIITLFLHLKSKNKNIH